MKKYAILLASVLALSAVACQKKPEAAPAPAAPAADAAAPAADAAKPAEAPQADAAKK